MLFIGTLYALYIFNIKNYLYNFTNSSNWSLDKLATYFTLAPFTLIAVPFSLKVEKVVRVSLVKSNSNSSLLPITRLQITVERPDFTFLAFFSFLGLLLTFSSTVVSSIIVSSAITSSFSIIASLILN